MKSSNSFILLFSLACLTGSTLTAQSAEEFSKRRYEVISQMEPGSAMIINSRKTSSEKFDNRRVGGYFYYLTGLDEANCTLILLSGDKSMPERQGGESNEILFISPVNSDRINWDAQTAGVEGAMVNAGIKDARPAGETNEFVGLLLAQKLSVLYMEVSTYGSVTEPLSEDEQIILKAREHGAEYKVLPPAVIIDPMMDIKSPAETDLMRKVVNITAEAQMEAMRSLKPGLYEYQLDAIIKYIFSINGSKSLSFPSIIGSGQNSVVLHWMENTRMMEDGDIVVVDCGAEYQMYCADITRTFPVNGRYSPRQRAIYEIVLKANKEAIKMIAPGVRSADVSNRADSVLADGMIKIGLIKDKGDFRRYYYHGLSHQIGLKEAFGKVPAVLEPGMIITIEPGIYIREEKLGVRIEDDVLVTVTGNEVLSRNAPKEIAEIEKIMKEPGTEVTRNVVR